MRKPQWPERLYLDFDGFFASCEQFKHKHLRNKPVGIVPMIKGSTSIIACSREAKKRGVANTMKIRDALRICPELILHPQDPDLYRRAHNELINEISMAVPIDTIKSIDELTCKLDKHQMRDPLKLGIEIKDRLYSVFGETLTCSIGFAANRLLAKMACKDSKPSGNLAWWPEETDAILRTKKLTDVPGIADGIQARLYRAGIADMDTLMDKGPTEMRALWRSVIGARMHYALHGYDIQANQTERGSFGHSRIIPPQERTIEGVRPISRILMVKAIRRMRRDGFRAGKAGLGLKLIGTNKSYYWKRERWMPQLADYTGILAMLEMMWMEAATEIPISFQVFSVDVWVNDLTPIAQRQLDMIANDDLEQIESEKLSDAMDCLQERYGKTIVTPGFWSQQKGDFMGAKISFGRIPRREDFQ